MRWPKRPDRSCRKVAISNNRAACALSFSCNAVVIHWKRFQGTMRADAMSQRTTIRDVADRAGCSIATVSRVLNESGPASAAIRDRVLKAAADLGFQFNEVGRSLQSQRSCTLAVIVPDLTNPVFAEATEGVQAEAAEAGYQILLACANYDPDAEVQCVTTLIAKQVDGILLTVTDPDTSDTLRLIEKHRLPYCLIFNQPGHPKRPAVGVDNIAAAAKVGDELVALGHRHMAFVALRFTASDRSRQRHSGFCQSLAAHGLQQPRLLEVDYAPTRLEPALGELLDQRPDITALFASNDMLALACMRALRRLGRAVPDDISVVGFDGIALAEILDPSLATIDTPCHRMGRTAARLVIDALETRRLPAAETVALDFQFRSGESLAACPTKKRRRTSGNLSAGSLQPFT